MNLVPPIEYHDKTIQHLVKYGCNYETAEDIFTSGYIYSAQGTDELLDTYYNLPVKTQMVLDQVSTYPPLQTETISSRYEALEAIHTVKSKLGYNGRLTFRGVNKEYFLNETTGRKYRSPIVHLSDGKEISCIPSAYRNSIPTIATCQPEDFFGTIWASDIEYAEIDLEAQVEKNFERGLYFMSDLENDENPINRKIWKRSMNRILSKDKESNVLAQHYGYPTSCLDLTFNISVALFFASYQFCTKDNGKATYIKKPTAESAVYFFWHEPAELADQARINHINLYKHLSATRPIRQKCLLAKHDRMSVNKSAAHIVFRLKLSNQFQFTGIPEPEQLFPSRNDDELYDRLLKLKNGEIEGRFTNSQELYKSVIEYDFS